MFRSVSVISAEPPGHIHGYCRRVKNRYSGLEHTHYLNLLNRDFKADAPMQKIVTDVTYIKYRGKWHYLAVFLDLYNNEILEW